MPGAEPAPRFRGLDDLRLVLSQTYYEQLSFWLNPVAAAFTIGFSVVFLVLLASSAGSSPSSTLGGLRQIQYYVPGFIAYGVMSVCFNSLTVQIVVRRETGQLKRLRLSPLPTPAFLAAVFVNAVIMSLLQTIVLLLIGRFAYHVALPHNVAALVVALVVGTCAFSALGAGVSTLVPNQEAGGPVVGVVFFVLLFLSGLWYPIDPHSALAHFSSFFPIRHLIVATYQPFDVRPGVSGWAWGDLWVLALWGLAGSVLALRRWSWAPYRERTRRLRRDRTAPAEDAEPRPSVRPSPRSW